jgi:hypothetical protein
MYVSAKQLLDAGLEGKWVKVSPEEVKAIVDSIPGENVLRNLGGPGTGGRNMRHYERGGYIVVTMSEAEKHPDDLAATA